MFLRIPGWLIILIVLLLASVIAERAKAETLTPDVARVVTQSPLIADSMPIGMFVPVTAGFHPGPDGGG
jgi:hypothetical protein